MLDAESLFNSTTWDWLAWSANYYRAALGDVLFQALPVKLRNGESAVKNDRTFLAYYGPWKTSVRIG